MTTWNVQFYANGELQTDVRLTSDQIQVLTRLINTMQETNEVFGVKE